MIRRRIASGQFAVIDRVPYPKKNKEILIFENSLNFREKYKPTVVSVSTKNKNAVENDVTS